MDAMILLVVISYMVIGGVMAIGVLIGLFLKFLTRILAWGDAYLYLFLNPASLVQVYWLWLDKIKILISYFTKRSLGGGKIVDE